MLEPQQSQGGSRATSHEALPPRWGEEEWLRAEFSLLSRVGRLKAGIRVFRGSKSKEKCLQEWTRGMQKPESLHIPFAHKRLQVQSYLSHPPPPSLASCSLLIPSRCLPKDSYLPYTFSSQEIKKTGSLGSRLICVRT